MADSNQDGPIAPRRTLGGPILPPPPPEMAEQAEQAKADEAEAREAEVRKEQLREAQKASREERLAQRDAEKTRKAEEREQAKRDAKAAKEQRKSRPAKAPRNAPPTAVPATAPAGKGAPRRTRRAQLRLVQVDAWSVMKTSFLLSIALGIVLVVAVAIIWAVLGAAGVWDSINSIVQQAVGSDNGTPFDIQQYAGTSRVLGFTMIVAVIDVILITAICTLGAFLYNLAAALLGGIEVTLAEDN
jgi:Transmembrane domain of unknown function (DUF3566)